MFFASFSISFLVSASNDPKIAAFTPLKIMGYTDAQEGSLARTAFRSAEKKYKRYTHLSSAKSRSRRARVPETDVAEVLDFRTVSGDGDGCGVSRVEGYEWPVYAIDKHPGFFFIPAALTPSEQVRWATDCLTTFPQPPNRTNHNAMYGPIADLWAAFQEKKLFVEVVDSGCHSLPEVASEQVVAERNRSHDDGTTTSGLGGGKGWEFCDFSRYESPRAPKSVSAETLVRKLRWATVGIQFDWSKRAYNEALPFREISPNLAELATRLAKPAMENEDFKAEAAIVNFYGPDDMLGGHVDDMEADMSKPIVSVSLGCKAVFLLGGPTRDEPPLAMFVRSGDVVLMAGSARHCFHGVPRIFSDEKESELPDFTSVVSEADVVQLRPILNYLRNSRINVNIRQVH